MFWVEVIGSGSDGNCYLFRTETETLIVECGVSIQEIKRALRFNLRGIVGCLVTHRHKDHCKSLVDVCKSGIKCFALSDVFDSFDDTDRVTVETMGHKIEAGKGYKIGNFNVFAFSSVHDVPCLGFVISHLESGRILFVTDSVTCNYTFPNLEHIMIECNYSDAILDYNIDQGIEQRNKRNRLMVSHCELGTVKKILNRLDLRDCKDIMLLHLSKTNGNPDEFRGEIQRETGKLTYVAEHNLSVDFTVF